MAAHLTDKQKKKIVADYLETQSINLTAKNNNVSWATAKSVLDEMGDIEEKLEQKKAENTADIIAYMEAHKDKVCEIIDVSLEVLPEKIQNAKTAADVTTALGTILDKWAAINDKNSGKDDPVKVIIDV